MQGTTGDRTARETCKHTLPHLPTSPLFHQPAITLIPYLHLSTSIQLPDNQVQKQNQEPSSDERTGGWITRQGA